MNKWQILALLLGALLLSAPLVRSEEEYDEGDDEGDAAAGGADDDKDVVVVTEKNFEEKVKGSKFALVSGCGRGDGEVSCCCLSRSLPSHRAPRHAARRWSFTLPGAVTARCALCLFLSRGGAPGFWALSLSLARAPRPEPPRLSLSALPRPPHRNSRPSTPRRPRRSRSTIRRSSSPRCARTTRCWPRL